MRRTIKATGRPAIALLAAGIIASAGMAERPDASDPKPQPPAKTRGADWPDFLGPNRNGKSSEVGLLKQWPASGPPIVWHKQIGEGYGVGSISRGRMFQFDRYGDRHRLTAMDAKTGKQLWRFEYETDYEDLLGYNNGPRSSPVVDGDRVYTIGPEGILHCLNTADGKVIWKLDTSRKFGVVQNFFGVGGTPLVEGELLIANIGGSPPGSPEVYSGRTRGAGSGVVALDKRTGEIRYKVTDELASYASPVAATIHGRRWCFVFARGGLIALEPTSGKVDFHYPWRSTKLESVNASTPVIVGDRVLISETYGPGAALLKVKPGGYEEVWKDGRRRDKSLEAHWNTPIHHRGFVYASSGRHTNEAQLRCVQWNTGKVMWSEPGLTRCSLFYADDRLVCLGEDGSLRLLRPNPKRYDEVSAVRLTAAGKTLLKYPAWAAPILSHGLLYVRGKDRLVCLDMRERRD